MEGEYNTMNNTSSYEIVNKTSNYSGSFYPDYSQIFAVRLVFIILFGVECLLAVVGNLMVCAAVYKTQGMHSPVNYYIVSLAVSDFFIGAFVLPVKLFELTSTADDFMTDGLCTALNYLQSVIVFASVLTLVAICLERYYAVVHPMRSRMNMTTRRVFRVLVAVWVLPCFIAAPHLCPAVATNHTLYSEYGEFKRYHCEDSFSDGLRTSYYICLFLFMYVLPLLFISATCISIANVLLKKIPVRNREDHRTIVTERNRQKVAKMVIVIVFAFFVCWSPYFLVTIVSVTGGNFFNDGHFFFTMLCINSSAFLNSCVNPFVYFTMSERFRKSFTNIFCSIFICVPRANIASDEAQGSTTSSHRREGTVTAVSIYRSNTNSFDCKLRQGRIDGQVAHAAESNGNTKVEVPSHPGETVVVFGSNKNKTQLLRKV